MIWASGSLLTWRKEPATVESSTPNLFDPRGMAAIEIRHPEFAAGTAELMILPDDIFQVLAVGFEGIV